MKGVNRGVWGKLNDIHKGLLWVCLDPRIAELLRKKEWRPKVSTTWEKGGGCREQENMRSRRGLEAKGGLAITTNTKLVAIRQSETKGLREEL
ncbi:hypothetical protein HPP92_004348 [Vanilla planifolia]|uniref:Uncharacterized protein n=1 Tax=Vanilla planifolia TaxID=51239 RepID=A0A835RKW4_VANPL|nr:hypothetical protein HPP92_004348 [Vanilla planifolia]